MSKISKLKRQPMVLKLILLVKIYNYNRVQITNTLTDFELECYFLLYKSHIKTMIVTK